MQQPTFADLIDSHEITSFYGLMYERIFAPIRDSATNVIEIGCGSGALTHVMRMYFSAADVRGIDIDVSKVEERWLHKDINYLNIDARLEGLGYLSGKMRSYDVIIEDTNATVDEHASIMDNMGPYVKPGGYYIIEAADCQNNISLYTNVATKYRLEIFGYDHGIAVFRKQA